MNKKEQNGNNRVSFVSTIPVFSLYIAKGMGVGLLIFLGVFSLMAIPALTNGGTYKSLTPDIYYAFGFVGLIFFFTYIAMWILFPNGFMYRATLDEKGVVQVSVTAATKLVSRAAILGGILRGSPGAVGTGILAEAGEKRYLSWREIKVVKINTKNRYCYFSIGRFGLFPIGFTCPEQYFERVKKIVKQKYVDSK